MQCEQINFNFDDDKIVKVCSLIKSDIPMIARVDADEKTLKACESFDYDFTGENKFYPYLMPDIVKSLDFNILVITGASGKGKSTFSKYFGKEKEKTWDLSKSIVANFNNAEEAVDKLNAVGLSSIPTWCRPYNVLSTGEKFRADLARSLEDNCVIDEFTSTVNRETALSCSASVGKYIRKHNLKKCVFVSCHKDFIDELCPDYVIDLDDECVYDTRRCVRRRFELSIYETQQKAEMWKLFKQHHYLSADMNSASRVFVAYFKDIPVALCSVLPQPGVHNLNSGVAYRVHRLVVLPDYQGLGIGSKLLNHIADLYSYHNKRLYIRTSHPKLISYLCKSANWEGDGVLEHSHKQTGLLANASVNTKRLSTSFHYIAKCKNDSAVNYDCISFPTQNDSIIRVKEVEKYTKEELW